MARKVFYSFYYKRDNWRVAQVRNMGVVVGIEDALTKYGVNPNCMQANMIYLRKSRAGSDEVIKRIKRSAITALTAALVGLWQGIKTILNGG